MATLCDLPTQWEVRDIDGDFYLRAVVTLADGGNYSIMNKIDDWLPQAMKVAAQWTIDHPERL